MKYGFIGYGNLARAIHQGLKDQAIEFACSERGTAPTELPCLDSIRELARFADVLFICVKPQDLIPVLEDLRASDLAKKIVVSCVAGKTIRFIEGYLGADKTIARIMPNLAVAYGKSVTAYADNSETEITKKVYASLEKLGSVIELPEHHFDRFTAIFGSGPAFLLEVLNVFKGKILEMDLPPETVNGTLKALVDGTMAYYLANADKSAAELTGQIASPGGTTEAGLQVLHDKGMSEALNAALESARKRSETLNKE